MIIISHAFWQQRGKVTCSLSSPAHLAGLHTQHLSYARQLFLRSAFVKSPDRYEEILITCTFSLINSSLIISPPSTSTSLKLSPSDFRLKCCAHSRVSNSSHRYLASHPPWFDHSIVISVQTCKFWAQPLCRVWRFFTVMWDVKFSLR
jgi:hypothetical protein